MYRVCDDSNNITMYRVCDDSNNITVPDPMLC